jgi:dephospho-CoA kinase
LGEKAYKQSTPDRTYIANKIFNDATLLSGMNSIIHPKVASHFKRWIKKQDAPYCIKEAAILFENGGYTQCDATILVTAPKEIRIARVMTRDAISMDKVEARIRNQWKDEKKVSLATYVIENIALEGTKKSSKKNSQGTTETLCFQTLILFC